MPRITESILKKHIKDRKFCRIYFLHGEEKYLLEHYSKEIEKSVLGESDRGFNLHSFDPQNFKLEKFSSVIWVLPVFSDYVCIKIINIAFDKLTEDKLKIFENILKEIPSTTVLIINQANDSPNGKTSQKQKLFLQLMEIYAAVIKFKKMSPAMLCRQLSFWAKSLNTNLSNDCASELVLRCGRDLGILRHELSKLCALSGYKKITSDMIDESCNKSFEATIFLFSQMIIEKNYYLAYKHLSSLIFSKIEPIVILSAISASFVDLYRAKIAIENKKDFQETGLLLKYGRLKFRMEVAYRDCEKISKDQLVKCIELIINTNFLLRQSGFNKETLLKEMIAKISLINASHKKCLITLKN
ncbi:MAG: DNA polymerase III subunit delta [Oscillospiraceae bacterium]|nr:DNA polymerase III subunit delta [Oscillospiraceae bacterium]